MKQVKRKFNASFKTKVAIEAIKESETLSSLAVKYEISPVMICKWEKEFLANASAVFETHKNDDSTLEHLIPSPLVNLLYTMFTCLKDLFVRL